MGQIDKYWDKIHLQYNSTYDNWLNKYVYLFNKNSRIIELGCGRAYCSKYLLDNGFKNIVACDIRVSTEDQVREGFSLPEQEKRLRAMCEYKNYEVYDVYEERGISAKTGNYRPEFERLLQDVRDKKVNTSFIYASLILSNLDFWFFNSFSNSSFGFSIFCLIIGKKY
jgi:hypothetical protein